MSLIPLGIHIGLPADRYHEDPGLGSGSLKEIARSPTEFQYKRLHVEDADTDALVWGRMIHLRVLEGKKAFRKAYAPALDPAKFPKALVTMADLQDWCRKHATKPGRTKQDAIAAIRQREAELREAADDTVGALPLGLQRRPPVQIWDELVEAHAAKHAGREIIKKDRYDRVETAAQWMQADKLLGAVMKDGTFIGGLPEVSIFYVDEETGIRLKARLDYLLAHAVVDLKSFRDPNDGFDVAGLYLHAMRTIRRFGYDLQAAAYRKAWHAGREAFTSGRVYFHGRGRRRAGNLAATEHLAEVYKRDAPSWIWVLIKSTGAPQPVVLEWREDKSRLAWGFAADRLTNAVLSYREWTDRYGPEAEWPPHHKAFVIDDGDWPG